MCEFKSGIILKNKVVIAPGRNNSHSGLLDDLGIGDTYLNASKTFVRAELIPENDAWWINPKTHPQSWKFVVDQDIVPDWFNLDFEKYENDFRQEVYNWWKKHVLVNQKINELNKGYYLVKYCEINTLCQDVKVELDESIVGEMRDESVVCTMYNSKIGVMHERSKISAMWNDSIVYEMEDNSYIMQMNENSNVYQMRCMSHIGWLFHNSKIGEMHGNSMVREMHKDSSIDRMYDDSIAISHKNYPNIEIFTPSTKKFKLVSFDNKT